MFYKNDKIAINPHAFYQTRITCICILAKSDMVQHKKWFNITLEIDKYTNLCNLKVILVRNNS